MNDWTPTLAELRDYCANQHDAWHRAMIALIDAAIQPKPCEIVMRHKTAEGGYRYIECPDCHRLIETQHPIEIDLPYCGGCGHAVWDGGAKFCSECGRVITAPKEGEPK